MVCLACSRWDAGPLCRRCRAGLVAATPRRIPDGLLVVAAYRHEGTARRLVHRLKYRGLEAAASVLAEAMAAQIPPGAGALVPVPRARLRSWRLGVDPAASLTAALGRLTGLPVRVSLGAGWWWPRHAGRDRAGRVGRPSFAPVGRWPPGAILVDDVLTTGATLRAAAAAAGPVAGAVTATAAGI